MFGRHLQAPQKDWSSMYFYEKLHHLVDHTADFVIAKVNWWVPSVAVSIAVNLFLLSGPESIPNAASIILPSAWPVSTMPQFASTEVPQGGAGAPEEEEEV